MSDSKSPETSPSLPRRWILKALAAVPPAAIATTPGQAFSSAIPAPDLKKDDRYVEAERLMGKVNETYNRFLAVNDREGEINDEGEDIYDAASDRWSEAKDALRAYAEELAQKTSKDLTDTLILVRIADFQLVDDWEDISVNLEVSVPEALRAVLEAHGITATEDTASSIETARFKAEKASEPPEPPRTPGGVTAGEAIVKIRALRKAYEAGLTRECCLDDDTPQMLAATAVTDRRYSELEALRDAIFADRPSDVPLHRWINTSPYSFNQRDDLVVWLELMTAYRSELLTNPPDDPASQILCKLLKRARETGDELVEAAHRWNASQATPV